MTTKTITYDDSIYKVVPVEPTPEINQAGQDSGKSCAFSYPGCYRAMLAAVPDTLPGVVAHSGKPIYWLEAEESARNADPRDIFGKYSILYSARTSSKEPDGSNPRWPLFTHPPAQPDTEALKAEKRELVATVIKAERFVANEQIADLQARIAELEATVSNAKLIIANLKDQLAAQAGQSIPVMVLAWHEAEQARLDAVAAYNTAFEAAKKYGFPGPCTDREYQAMTAAGNKAHALKAPMHEQMKELLYTTPPAPANSLAIVQAALEAAAVEATGMSNLANRILALDPQAILDGVSK